MGWDDLLTASSQELTPILVSTMSERARTVGRHIWHLLLTKCEGKAIELTRSAGTGHGLEAWRLLKQEYEGMEGGRPTGMLRFILNPKDRWQADKEAGHDLMHSLVQWDNLIMDYTQQSGEPITENIKVSTLLEHLPDPFREILHQGGPAARANYTAARNHLRSYASAGKPFVLPST